MYEFNKQNGDAMKKTIPSWAYVLGLILFGVLAYLFIGNAASAQPYRFDSRVNLKNVNLTDSTVVIRIVVPSAELTMLRKGMGKGNANEALDEIGRNTALDIKRLVERMYQKQRDDARDFIPQTEIDKALDARKAYEDTLGKTQGALLPSELPDIEPVGEYASLSDINPSGNLRNIGKAVFTDYAPVFESSGVFKTGHAVYYTPPSWAAYAVLVLAIVGAVAIIVAVVS